MNIRPIQEEDAERFLQLRKRIVGETPFMLWSPDEIAQSVEQQRKHIKRLLRAHLLLVAEHDKQLVGLLMGIRGDLKRTRHRLSIVVGVLQAFTHQGIGTRLLTIMEEWAHQKGIIRLELHVLINNVDAIALYKKCGFVLEGTRRYAQYIEGVYIDEYMMAKILPS
jgi:RimJ/RimL family protein N-acetyltransferase